MPGQRRDHADGPMKPIKRLLQFSAAAIGLSVGACSAGADRSIYELVLLKDSKPPTATHYPQNSSDLKSQVKRDGYPDPNFVPNPERLPELTEEEREVMKQDLRTAGRERMENRVMTCGAEDPADCVE